MHELFKKVTTFILKHKLLTVFAVVLIGIALYFLFRGSSTTETRYVTGTVEKGTIVASISGGGQVAATNSVDLKAKTSGTITYVAVKPGDTVTRGQTIAAVDARDAQQAVRTAQTELETAELDLAKFQEPPKSVEVLAIETAIKNAEKSKEDAVQNVKDAYRALLNTSTAVRASDTTSTQSGPTISGTYTKDVAAQIYIEVHEAGSNAYYSVSSIPSGIVVGTGNVSSTIPQPLGDSGLYIKFSSTNLGQQTWIIDLPNKTPATYEQNLAAYNKAIDDQKKTERDAELTIAQNKENLAELYTPDALELRAKKLAVQQKQDALLDAKNNLADCYVTAPFSGTVASVSAIVGQDASSSIATIITQQKIASITLNEVDVSKIALGDKATLTFDAIEDLTLTGEVAEIDTVGTVSQGVVNYTVKISFDTDDIRIKPGMSVSAGIITDTRVDVLTVPSSAIKTNTAGSYVEVFSPAIDSTSTDGQTGVISKTAPQQVSVEVGISDDSLTEIISGLTEGEQIVTRTISTTTTKTTTSSAPSLFGGNSTTNRSTNNAMRSLGR